MAVIIALLVGCASVATRSNPNGEITKLAFDSAIDPNSFIDFRMMAPPQNVRMKDGTPGFLFHLANPDPNGIPTEAIIITGENGVMLAYIYALDGEVLSYVLNPKKNRYILFVPKEDKRHGV